MSAAAAVPFASFAGVDLHKQTVTLRAVSPAAEPIAALTCDTKCVERIRNWMLALPRPSHLAVEAVGFVEWFIDRFRDAVDRIDIADATELANRRGKRRKTDRNDAHDIAVRLARGDCPHLLKDVQREAFANFLDIVCLIERQREPLRRKIIFANREDRFAALTAILKSVPGIEEIWACIIAAEIGDFSRFPNADALEFWAGMTADLKESAGRTQSGRITKAGSATLRWAICQAALTLCRSDARQEGIRQRLIRRVGKPKANVAMGRRLLRILFAMVRDGTLYRGQEPTGHERNANKVRLRKQRRKAAA